MSRCHRSTQRARRVRSNNIILIIITADRAGWQTARLIELNVGQKVSGKIYCLTSRRTVFNSKLIGSRVNLAKVVDTGIGLAGGARLDEVRNRNGCQQADDSYDNHDFYEGETAQLVFLLVFIV